MKLAVFVTVFFMLFSFCLPAMAQTDNEILPEAVSAEKAVDKESAEPGEPAWGAIIVGLMLGGFLFLFLEIAIIPGFGAAGIIGLLLLGSGLVFAFLKLSMTMAVAATVSAMVGLVFLLIWFFYYFPKTSLGKKFVLEAESSVEDGCIAVQDLKRYVGKEGVTQTMLRPSGIALVEGERLDVISDCEFLEKGTPVKIVKATGGRLVVAAKDPE